MSLNKEHIIDFNTTDFKSHIVNTIIKPNYINEIHDSTKHRTMWKKRAMRFETCSKMFIGIGSIVSFASGVYGYQTLSFVSGAISTLSLVLLQYANFSYKESKKATSDLNILLDNIGVKKVPELNTATQDENEPMMKGTSSKLQGSGYTPAKNSVSFTDNPTLSHRQQQAVRYEKYCYNDNFIEIKKMYEDEKYILTDLVLERTAETKNLEMFKYFLTTGIVIEFDRLIYVIARKGIEFIKPFFEAYTYCNQETMPSQYSPMLGAIESNQIEAVKYMYEKYPTVTKNEINLAEQYKNEEIVEFLKSKFI